MKYCQNCGSPCDDTDLICKYCGTMLVNQADQSGAGAAPQQTANQPYAAPYPGAGGAQGDGLNNPTGQNRPYTPSLGPAGPGFYAPQNTYGSPQPFYPGSIAVPRNNSLAVAAMVLGIVGVAVLACDGLGIVPAILAIIFGFISKSSIKKSGGIEAGRGMSITGIVLGFAAVAITIVIAVVLIVVAVYSGVITQSLNGFVTSSGPSFNT